MFTGPEILAEFKVAQWRLDVLCSTFCVPSTSPFNIIALDRLKNLMNIAFIGNTEDFQIPAISSYLLSCQWTSNIVPATISLHQFPEDVSVSLPIVHAKVSALSFVTERVSPEGPGKYSM